jgi:hypothetical protein
MEVDLINEAIELLEKANAGLKPELLKSRDARDLLSLYARVEKLGAFGRVALARKLDDAAEIAGIAGTSIGKAKETVARQGLDPGRRPQRCTDARRHLLGPGDVHLQSLKPESRKSGSSKGGGFTRQG